MNWENYMRVLKRIEADPSKWDQGSWFSKCGTRLCFAGHAWRLSMEHPGISSSTISEWLEEFSSLELGHLLQKYANDFLGLKSGEDREFWLFSPERTLDDFRMLARCYGRIGAQS